MKPDDVLRCDISKAGRTNSPRPQVQIKMGLENQARSEPKVKN